MFLLSLSTLLQTTGWIFLPAFWYPSAVTSNRLTWLTLFANFCTVRRIEEFKNQKIIPHIVQEEALEGNFVKYLYAQDVLYAQEIYSLIEDDKE